MPKKPSKSVTPTTQDVAKRVQRAVSMQNDGVVPKDNYSTRLTSAADRQKAKAPENRKPEIKAPSVENRGKQLNPNNEAYWRSRGHPTRPEDWAKMAKSRLSIN
jgi:hypothetical protein